MSLARWSIRHIDEFPVRSDGYASKPRLDLSSHLVVGLVDRRDGAAAHIGDIAKAAAGRAPVPSASAA
jgi:hypothetical protein